MKWLAQQRGFAAVILLAVALFSWWLLRSGAAVRNGGTTEHGAPDYYVKGYDLAVWDAHGELRHRLTGPHIVHHRQHQRADLTSPELTLYREDAPRWRLRAQTAQVNDNASEVWLQGEVVIDEPLDADGVVLNTRDVRVLPEKRYAETRAQVAVRDPAGEMHGTGMRADLSVDRLELLSAVRGEYALP